jgi:dethiobiotin synthetase
VQSNSYCIQTHTHADERLGREKYRPLENNLGINAAQQQRRTIEIESLESREQTIEKPARLWLVEGGAGGAMDKTRE